MGNQLILITTIRRLWSLIRMQGLYRQLTIISLALLTVIAIVYGIVSISIAVTKPIDNTNESSR